MKFSTWKTEKGVQWVRANRIAGNLSRTILIYSEPFGTHGKKYIL
jgi:hypothetical protein